ncbi:MAG: hypothetical protein PHG27_02790 [Massilibacteroides sp.]|nr:hypothetical protein [Massilibacteroides sp.]MDD3062554.1 hypothetical protein [Massilibacteroides sp.]MDD4114513.1 hypothetical protein [Massilibacteroides sp.]
MNKTKLNLLIIELLIQLLAYTAYGQEYSCDKTMEESLQQTALILNKPESKALWGMSLNSPIIIVDHFNNTMFFTTIEDGSVASIKEEPWDNKVPLANSFFDYNDKRYVTIVHAALMNSTCEQRVNLLCHEIFHTYQQSLGIKNQSSVNYHMDEVQGRALLQIEMKALQQALSGDLARLKDALHIRAYRQSIYSNNNEDLYELNEGLAEYTGVKLSIENIREYVASRLNYNISRGYTNAFGYFTGSAYATILDDIYPQWRYDIDLAKGLIYLIKKIKPQYAPEIDKRELDKLLTKYDYNQILVIEQEELNNFGDIGKFKNLLNSEASKLCIANQSINFTYNPHDRVISLGDAVLLRNMTITGEWGQINSKNGIVRLNNWSAFYLLPPSNITANVIQGDNYEIRLYQGWTVSEKNGIYEIVKE